MASGVSCLVLVGDVEAEVKMTWCTVACHKHSSLDASCFNIVLETSTLTLLLKSPPLGLPVL